ncbi:16S rRNA (uracil(1498)-N(3))-methyltransferase [Corynebacterium sp. ES2775-CONJ]|uniref:16S rRNA (uracil(1498)-N(3))-methyltransferase n=1 Tax=Corynebacterium sp. ES2775-CONJ TaxID=2974029 RepID=UPI00216AAA2B|nr:16S rRNA (uracil(1498)-N(3))-methyltransferase [Corynebacterium sp. ES2775-CONJ]MCS4490578.1 16S rRNA (uracil(1498)-N(3))-methyltransferase [Corynebacterium sp. ES2775-CONJ]
MSLPVFLHSAPLPQTGAVELTGSEGRHAVSAKRIGIGEHIELVDGHGSRALIEVQEISGKDTLRGMILQCDKEIPQCPHITVIQALPKSERSELTVDLLTQAGADAIVPWQASRCIAQWSGPKADKGIKKWQSAVLAAAKQSRRSYLPEIYPLSSTPQLREICTEMDLVLVLAEDSAQPIAQALRDYPHVQRLALIVGPEGGISPEEYQVFIDLGAHLVKLGPEVLRTAAAGMAALAALGVLTPRWSL